LILINGMGQILQAHLLLCPKNRHNSSRKVLCSLVREHDGQESNQCPNLWCSDRQTCSPNQQLLLAHSFCIYRVPRLYETVDWKNVKTRSSQRTVDILHHTPSPSNSHSNPSRTHFSQYEYCGMAVPCPPFRPCVS
jgi:hypothetical protein